MDGEADRARGFLSGRLTVVLPVRDEGANLASWWDEARPHLPPGSVVRVVYDRDNDDTLPVARRLASDGAPVELLRSAGTGFAAAVLTGLRSVRDGPVLVTMVDRSDDPAALPRMLEEHARGAAVVVASRHMPGGRRIGGGRLKAALARWGSLALHRIAGFPVRDATNAFRLYDARAFARSAPASGGAEISFELTLEAWRRGLRVVEVPTTWRDRRPGAGRLRPWRSLPAYARLWLAALALGPRVRRAAPPPARR